MVLVIAIWSITGLPISSRSASKAVRTWGDERPYLTRLLDVAQVVVRGVVSGREEPHYMTGYGMVAVYHVEISDLIVGHDFLPDTTAVSFIETADTMAAGFVYPPTQYTPVIGTEYVVLLSGPLDHGQRVAVTPPVAIVADSVTVPGPWDRWTVSAYTDTIRSILSDRSLEAAQSESELTAVVSISQLVVGASLPATISTFNSDAITSTARFASVYEQPGEYSFASGDTLEFYVARESEQDLNPSFAVGDTTLLFLNFDDPNWALVPRTIGGWTKDGDSYVVLANSPRKVGASPLFRYPVLRMSEQDVQSTLNR